VGEDEDGFQRIQGGVVLKARDLLNQRWEFLEERLIHKGCEMDEKGVRWMDVIYN